MTLITAVICFTVAIKDGLTAQAKSVNGFLCRPFLRFLQKRKEKYFGGIQKSSEDVKNVTLDEDFLKNLLATEPMSPSFKLTNYFEANYRLERA